MDLWASLYDDESKSAELLHEVHDTYYLVAVVDNNFIDGNLWEVCVSDECMRSCLLSSWLLSASSKHVFKESRTCMCVSVYLCCIACLQPPYCSILFFFFCGMLPVLDVRHTSFGSMRTLSLGRFQLWFVANGSCGERMSEKDG